LELMPFYEELCCLPGGVTTFIPHKCVSGGR
jgi:hypothetical protein